jgi:hypothetical protein
LPSASSTDCWKGAGLRGEDTLRGLLPLEIRLPDGAHDLLGRHPCTQKTTPPVVRIRQHSRLGEEAAADPDRRRRGSPWGELDRIGDDLDEGVREVMA